MAAPQIVHDLVERFRLHREDYESPAYKEAQLRQEFIDPLLKALGWDVDNEQGFAEAYKDVIHEDAIKVSGSPKAPDYCLRIGGTRKFFFEAKKPAENVKEDKSHAYQLRRYGWSSKLPLSVLSSFAEWAVYDCRIKPAEHDKASVARVMYFTFEQLAEKWDEFAGIFSREAVLKGSFDKYAETNKKKRGTAEVDAAFLAEIERWRVELAKNLALRNEKLDTRDLNFAVQRIIDRLIFLRIAEDRGIEDYGRLQSLLNGDKVYRRLGEMFRRADERYNSGIFHFEPEKDRAEPPDELTLDLEIDDKVLKEIIEHLYYPESPYEFSVLSADILGQVYEQFLGKVITLTAGHRAKVEEKPEVKKAGGVYYTPTYIVDYIVQQTVGKLLEGKTPKQAAKLKILDPACGSGSFLIGAYQYLLDWHLKWYIENDPGNRKDIYQDHTGATRLTIAERKRILLHSIYGVDIDSQAVEVTKLSLVLKVLEGASRDVLERQRKLFHERALPDLGKNIKCGNSLIGPDFYNGQQLAMFDEEERYRINVFDWSGKDGFPEIMKAGGFDAVIGNPPYVRMETLTRVKDYLRVRYACHEERADLYAYFLERGVSLLNATGRFGMIVSNKFIKAKYGRPLRTFLREGSRILVVADFAGANVFRGATVRTCILILRPNGRTASEPIHYVPVPAPEFIASFETRRGTVADYAEQNMVALGADSLDPLEWKLSSQEHQSLLEKIRTSAIGLAEFVGSNAQYGIKTGLNEAFIVDEVTANRLMRASRKSSDILKPILFGREIRRYGVESKARFIIYLHPNRDVDDYPAIKRHLQQYKRALENRALDQKWYELQQPAVGLLPLLSRPKIIFPIIANECRFVLDREGYLINDKAFAIASDDPALVGLLNSRLAFYFFRSVCAALEGQRESYLEFRSQYVDRFPVPTEFAESKWRKSIADRAVEMHSLTEKLRTAKNPNAQTVIQRQIEATNRQIDQLVYELYGLTDDEIRLVEEATQ